MNIFYEDEKFKENMIETDEGQEFAVKMRNSYKVKFPQFM